ncbi:TRAP transporter small permease [Hoeflea sp. WL0058]|uniref:TRAP transporter small permease protein n=1 Tax=Flavimaribacter sediminis TaxID=2865987 RepID=A0AAE2ZNL5_9HYPH|nr:TRAP transporter small permease [Flavimaribacter sediminis]MBW8637870.1 TRAP transporter small permease [Flavimaribacter sediminis]
MIRILNVTMAMIAGACLLLMMVQIVVDVTARLFLGAPIGGTMETVSVYYMVAITFLPLVLVQSYERHLAVDLFTQNMSGRTRHILDISTRAFALVFALWLLKASIDEALYSHEIKEMIETAASVMPVWPSRFTVVVGIAAMVIVLAVQIIRLVLGRSAAVLQEEEQ